MRFTQERIIQIIDTATKHQNNIIEIQKRIVPEIQHIATNETGGDPKLKESLNNLATFITTLTNIDIEDIVTLAREKEHFNPARIKHNQYMRHIHHRRKAIDRLAADPLDLGPEEPRQNNAEGRQNNVANSYSDVSEVPLLAQIERDEKELQSKAESEQ